MHRGFFLPRIRPLALICAMFCVLKASDAGGGQPELLVCTPGNPNVQQIQQTYETLVGQGTVLAFGRIRDVENILATSPEVSMIAPALFFDASMPQKIVLQSKTGGELGQKYFIVVASDSVTKENIDSKKIGILDFLGREKLPKFVSDFFGISSPILKRANKVEDLLTMLGMEAVDAIIVSAAEYKKVKADTKLPLKIIGESSRPVPLLALGIPASANAAKIKKLISEQPALLSKLIEIDAWEAR